MGAFVDADNVGDTISSRVQILDSSCHAIRHSIRKENGRTAAQYCNLLRIFFHTGDFERRKGRDDEEMSNALQMLCKCFAKRPAIFVKQ